MAGDSWKGRERRVARAFGVERTPLSGSNSGHTGSDSLHPSLYIEAKTQSHPLIEEWNEHRDKARRRGLPTVGVVVLCRKRGDGSPLRGVLMLWHSAAWPSAEACLWPGSSWLVPYYSARDSLWSLYSDTAIRAEPEDKTPLVALFRPRRKGFWLACEPGDYPQVIAERDHD